MEINKIVKEKILKTQILLQQYFCMNKSQRKNILKDLKYIDLSVLIQSLLLMNFSIENKQLICELITFLIDKTQLSKEKPIENNQSSGSSQIFSLPKYLKNKHREIKKKIESCKENKNNKIEKQSNRIYLPFIDHFSLEYEEIQELPNPLFNTKNDMESHIRFIVEINLKDKLIEYEDYFKKRLKSFCSYVNANNDDLLIESISENINLEVSMLLLLSKVYFKYNDLSLLRLNSIPFSNNIANISEIARNNRDSFFFKKLTVPLIALFHILFDFQNIRKILLNFSRSTDKKDKIFFCKTLNFLSKRKKELFDKNKGFYLFEIIYLLEYSQITYPACNTLKEIETIPYEIIKKIEALYSKNKSIYLIPFMKNTSNINTKEIIKKLEKKKFNDLIFLICETLKIKYFDLGENAQKESLEYVKKYSIKGIIKDYFIYFIGNFYNRQIIDIITINIELLKRLLINNYDKNFQEDISDRIFIWLRNNEERIIDQIDEILKLISPILKNKVKNKIIEGLKETSNTGYIKAFGEIFDNSNDMIKEALVLFDSLQTNCLYCEEDFKKKVAIINTLSKVYSKNIFISPTSALKTLIIELKAKDVDEDLLLSLLRFINLIINNNAQFSDKDLLELQNILLYKMNIINRQISAILIAILFKISKKIGIQSLINKLRFDHECRIQRKNTINLAIKVYDEFPYLMIPILICDFSLENTRIKHGVLKVLRGVTNTDFGSTIFPIIKYSMNCKDKNIMKMGIKTAISIFKRNHNVILKDFLMKTVFRRLMKTNCRKEEEDFLKKFFIDYVDEKQIDYFIIGLCNHSKKVRKRFKKILKRIYKKFPIIKFEIENIMKEI